ncbi:MULTISPECIES: SOS response-associated peptidase [unclassified Thioalkalivibrio]|uniref:SOS response-associated peptidase n=1 Tax=unclassified Thioalkalivibrio TaxID=2621013 RepID=UPI00039D9BE0|nr:MULTISPECIES: SOS response-associated peptidase [unclassified Thioalkalivibrio]
MCGRFDRTTPVRDVAHSVFQLSLEATPFDTPNRNTTPGAPIPAFAHDEFSYAHLRGPTWGFQPHWAKNGPKPINARAETVATSPYFRRAFAQRRCIIPADAWYEWQETPAGKQLYRIAATDEASEDTLDRVLLLAGIWEAAEPGREIDDPTAPATCAIITEPAAPHLSAIHDRQPLVLDQSCIWAWLSRAYQTREEVRGITKRLDPGQLVATAIDRIPSSAP